MRAGRGAYALLTDGTTIQIRAARPEDFAAVQELHAKSPGWPTTSRRSPNST